MTAQARCTTSSAGVPSPIAVSCARSSIAAAAAPVSGDGTSKMGLASGLHCADVRALGLEPLALRERGEWAPGDAYWGEEGEPIEEWAKPIIARGRRPMFEMEKVLPRVSSAHFDSDPIIEASALNNAGKPESAGFDRVLAWGLIDNRPFLRCMLGAGLCWWRLGEPRAAAALFRKMLWLNPSDNQGARFNLGDVEAGKAWNELER